MTNFDVTNTEITTSQDQQTQQVRSNTSGGKKNTIFCGMTRLDAEDMGLMDLFNKLNTDGDDQISENEFAVIDKNGDGKVSRREFKLFNKSQQPNDADSNNNDINKKLKQFNKHLEKLSHSREYKNADENTKIEMLKQILLKELQEYGKDKDLNNNIENYVSAFNQFLKKQNITNATELTVEDVSSEISQAEDEEYTEELSEDIDEEIIEETPVEEVEEPAAEETPENETIESITIEDYITPDSSLDLSRLLPTLESEFDGKTQEEQTIILINIVSKCQELNVDIPFEIRDMLNNLFKNIATEKDNKDIINWIKESKIDPTIFESIAGEVLWTDAPSVPQDLKDKFMELNENISDLVCEGESEDEPNYQELISQELIDAINENDKSILLAKLEILTKRSDETPEEKCKIINETIKRCKDEGIEIPQELMNEILSSIDKYVDFKTYSAWKGAYEYLNDDLSKYIKYVDETRDLLKNVLAYGNSDYILNFIQNSEMDADTYQNIIKYLLETDDTMDQDTKDKIKKINDEINNGYFEKLGTESHTIQKNYTEELIGLIDSNDLSIEEKINIITNNEEIAPEVKGQIINDVIKHCLDNNIEIPQELLQEVILSMDKYIDFDKYKELTDESHEKSKDDILFINRTKELLINIAVYGNNDSFIEFLNNSTILPSKLSDIMPNWDEVKDIIKDNELIKKYNTLTDNLFPLVGCEEEAFRILDDPELEDAEKFEQLLKIDAIGELDKGTVFKIAAKTGLIDNEEKLEEINQRINKYYDGETEELKPQNTKGVDVEHIKEMLKRGEFGNFATNGSTILGSTILGSTYTGSTPSTGSGSGAGYSTLPASTPNPTDNGGITGSGGYGGYGAGGYTYNTPLNNNFVPVENPANTNVSNPIAYSNPSQVRPTSSEDRFDNASNVILSRYSQDNEDFADQETKFEELMRTNPKFRQVFKGLHQATNGKRINQLSPTEVTEVVKFIKSGNLGNHHRFEHFLTRKLNNYFSRMADDKLCELYISGEPEIRDYLKDNQFITSHKLNVYFLKQPPEVLAKAPDYIRQEVEEYRNQSA